MEKARDTGHVAHKKLFYREFLLEKATYTGHVAHKKKQVALQGNSFGKDPVHWTCSPTKKQVILQGNSIGKVDVHWTRSTKCRVVHSYFELL